MLGAVLAGLAFWPLTTTETGAPDCDDVRGVDSGDRVDVVPVDCDDTDGDGGLDEDCDGGAASRACA